MPCLDTCVILDIRRPNTDFGARAAAKLRELRRRSDALSVSRFTWAELFVGICRSPEPAAEEASLRALLDPLRVLEFDEKASRLFGSLVAQLFRLGRPVGDLDVLIAATAVSAGQTVVTRDVEHFGRIPGLTVETY
jgi:tRNA(fMet)-specific endonuclease VapC